MQSTNRRFMPSNYTLGKKRVESLSNGKLESQFSFLRLRDFGDGIEARCEVFIPTVFRTPTLHIAQHSLAKVVFEESSKRLILFRVVAADHMLIIKVPTLFSETGDFVIVLLNIRIILCVDATPLRLD
jgi:hypothetical protein